MYLIILCSIDKMDQRIYIPAAPAPGQIFPPDGTVEARPFLVRGSYDTNVRARKKSLLRLQLSFVSDQQVPAHGCICTEGWNQAG